jgi:hypothetical protein
VLSRIGTVLREPARMTVRFVWPLTPFNEKR